MSRSRAHVYIAVLSVLAACDPDDACDPGYFADHGACYKQMMARQPNDDRDAGAEAGGGPVFSNDYSDFGVACSEQRDCGGAAPVCVAPTFPVCTNVNCENNAKLCPPGWNCLDVRGISPEPDVTSLCVNF